MRKLQNRSSYKSKAQKYELKTKSENKINNIFDNHRKAKENKGNDEKLRNYKEKTEEREGKMKEKTEVGQRHLPDSPHLSLLTRTQVNSKRNCASITLLL